MTESVGLRGIVNRINKGKHQPATSVVGNDPDTAALISKLVKPREIDTFKPSKEGSFYKMDQSQLVKISDSVKERISDNENIMQLFPDLELAQQILVSSILSPKDMVNVEFIFKTRESVLPAELTMKMTEIIRKECEGYYKLKSQIQDILNEVLFETGSYVKAVIPESAVDEIINGGSRVSTECLSEVLRPNGDIVSLGYLGSPKKREAVRPAFEGITVGLETMNPARFQLYEPGIVSETTAGLDLMKNIHVTDNFLLLKMPKVMQKVNSRKSRHLLRQKVGLENYGLGEQKKALSTAELEALLYKGTQSGAKVFVDMKTRHTAKRRSIGRPLTLKLPSESVIPVHVPGDERNHIGYFVLIDEEGNALNRHSNTQYFGGLQTNLNDQNSSVSGFLLSKARANLTSVDNRNLNIDQAANIYSGIVESDLMERLRNGMYGTNVQIAKNEEVYRIMLARSFANQFTRLVFMPADTVTYFAYKYYENGIGRSLLDSLKVLTSLRAILLFSKVMGMARNSIALTHVNMTLDPEDADPQKTVEEGVHEIIKMRQQYFPLGINSPTDLVDWVQRAGLEFSFEGHPGLPDTKFDFETKQMTHALPDNELDEILRKQTLMGIGLTPETVDQGLAGVEFATSVVANNIMLSKRVVKIQEVITPKITDYCQKICYNDFNLRETLMDALRENKGAIEKYITDQEKELKQDDEEAFLNSILDEFIDVLEVDLPRPDITTLENQSLAYTNYETAIDKAIDAWISSDFITDQTAGDVASNVDTIKSVFKSHFLRKWMAENGYMTELNDIVSTTEDGKATIDLFETLKDHVEGIARSSVKFLQSVQTMKNAANKDMNNMGVEGGDAGGGDFGSGDAGMDDGFGGGMDDTGGGEMPTMVEPPVDESVPV